MRSVLECCFFAADESQQLALLGPEQLQSQRCYAESVRRSSGVQWHPHSCAAFGWLNRMQAALCGDTDELLLLSSSWQANAAAGAANSSNAVAGAGLWLAIATHLFEQALAAVGGCTVVLRQYAAAAGKPDKSADKQLLEAVRDLWANLADACKAMAALQSMAAAEQQQQHKQQSGAEGSAAAAAVTDTAAAGTYQGAHSAAVVGSDGLLSSSAGGHEQQPGSSIVEPVGGHVGSDVPAAAAVTGHNMHLAAAVSSKDAPTAHQHQKTVLVMEDVLGNISWLLHLVQLMDAVCAYFGDESADLPAEFVKDFLVCAAAFTSPARAAAASQAAAAELLLSSRVRAFGEAGTAAAVAWKEMGLDLQQLLQMPGNRKRKRKEL
jgi:hypothetical protein